MFGLLTLLFVTSLSSGGIGPDAGTGVLVEVKAGGTLDLGGFTFDAVVEDVAHRGVGMGKESIAAGTL